MSIGDLLLKFVKKEDTMYVVKNDFSPTRVRFGDTYERAVTRDQLVKLINSGIVINLRIMDDGKIKTRENTVLDVKKIYPESQISKDKPIKLEGVVVDKVKFTGVSTVGLTDVWGMFNLNTVGVYEDLNKMVFSGVTNTTGMFSNSVIELLDLSKASFYNVRESNVTFSNCKIGTLNLTNIQLTKDSAVKFNSIFNRDVEIGTLKLDEGTYERIKESINRIKGKIKNIEIS